MERVTFNVGGSHFTTTLATLRTFGTDTMLGELSMKEDICKDVVFLDRDPTLFLHILNCMRHKRVFTAHQLDVASAIWELELAYYGLPNSEEKKPKEKKRPRPIDLVKERTQKKAQEVDRQREKIESVLFWMLSLYPTHKRFVFFDFDRAMHTKPEGMPENVFNMDAAYIRTYEKAWKSICLESDVHFDVTFGMGMIPRLSAPPVSLMSPHLLPAGLQYAEIRIRCFGDD